MRRGFLTCLSALLLASASLVAQSEYDVVENEALKIRFKVHKKLQPIPLKLAQTIPHYKMRYEPRSVSDHINGRLGTYEWYAYVLEFPKNLGGKPKAEPAPGGAAPSQAEKVEEAMRERMAPDFYTWATEKDPALKDRTFKPDAKGRDVKAKDKTPAHKWWEFKDKMASNSGQELFWYTCAAVYDFPDREIVIEVQVPVLDKHGTQPEAKHYKWQTTMCESLEILAGVDDDELSAVEAKKDQYATTPERQKDLEKAKANIANLAGWDYFTMPDYIVLYSWNADKGNERRNPSFKFAKNLVDQLEKMRDLYKQDYPPHEKMLQIYSILRVCDDYVAFEKYSDLPGGVVGVFNSLSKELVVFDDHEHLYPKLDPVATTMHEGWHQYAHTYFGEGIELHRWFDEGTGDYYGGFTKKGGSWSYAVSRGRAAMIVPLVAHKKYVPLREIVAWNKDKFYGNPKTVEFYAQGYAMVDFLRRGPKVLGSRFDPSWEKILDTYRATMLEAKDPKTAVTKAFEGVDFDKLEAAWMDWVKNNLK